MTDQILSALRKRPAVHQLCYGIYIQEPIWVQTDLLAVPLQALGFASQANYTTQYAREIAGAPVDQEMHTKLVAQGESSLPIVAVVYFPITDAAPEELERLANPILVQARRILGWTSGDEIIPFALVTSTTKHSFFRMLLPASRQRQRLGFGNTGDAYHSQIMRIGEAAKQDEHFEFALSLLHDALREANTQFKIARLFNCLECLAYKLKSKHGEKSRRAVKDLLGLPDGAMSEVHVNGQRYRFDVIEISGRLRDKLFHGVPFSEEDLNLESRPVFRLLETDPETILDSVLSYCEIEIARWANGVSKGLNLETP